MTKKQKGKNSLPLPVPLVTENKLFFAYSLGLSLPSSQSEVDSDTMSNSFGLQNIFNLLPFSIVNFMFFFIVY